MWRVAVAVVALAPAMLVGCDGSTRPERDGGDDPAPDARDDVLDPGGPRLEVGTGGTGFEEVADGGDVELVHGPQGGYHILLAARFRGVSPDGLLLSYQVFRGDGTTALNDRFSVRLRPSTVTPAGAWTHRTGDLGVLMVMGPDEVRDMAAEVHGEAVATDGTTLNDVLRLRIVDEVQ